MKTVIIPLQAFAALLSFAIAAPHNSANVSSFERRDKICGSKGWVTTDDYYYSETEGGYKACSAACAKDPIHCKSFTFDSTECHLFQVSVSRNLEEDADSAFSFYDTACISSTTTTTKTTTRGTTTTTTVTKTTDPVKNVPTTTPTKTSTTKPAASTTTSKPTTTTARTTTTTNKAASATTTTVAAVTTTDKPKTTTTTKAAPVTTTTTTTVDAPPCPLPTWTVSDFVFYNSSHNLDCAGKDQYGGLCYTGMPVQPAGYGPPDRVTAQVGPGIGGCGQSNPGSVPLRTIGDNVVRCGGSRYQFAFFGSSNTASSKATFNVQNNVGCDSGASYFAYGSVQFDMTCAYDDGKNATCTAVGGNVLVPATRFDSVYLP